MQTEHSVKTAVEGYHRSEACTTDPEEYKKAGTAVGSAVKAVPHRVYRKVGDTGSEVC